MNYFNCSDSEMKEKLIPFILRHSEKQNNNNEKENLEIKENC